MADKARDASELSDEALKCRDLGHAWRRLRDFNEVRGSGGRVAMLTREVQCRDCGATRLDNYDRYNLTSPAGISAHQYHYPDRYLGERGAELRGPAVREEELRRSGFLFDNTEPEPSTKVTPIKRRSRTRKAG